MVPFGQYGFSIAVYVIGIMIAISGISVGLGYAINEKKFKEFGKHELYQSILNGALVGGLLALFSSNGMVSIAINQLTVSNSTYMQCPSAMSGNSAMCLAYNYLIGSGYSMAGTFHPSILATSTLLLTGLFALNAALGAIASVKISVFIVTISFSYIVNPLIMEINYIIRMLSTIAIGAVVQGSVLLFIDASAITLILPAGIILRSLYLTRRLGGFLMALSIGLYVVLPLAYVFDAAIASSYGSQIDLNSITNIGQNATNIESNVYGEISATSSNSLLYRVSSSAISAVQSLSGAFSGMANLILQGIAYLIVYTFVLPAFSLIITGVAVREFAQLLGAEASFGIFKLM